MAEPASLTIGEAGRLLARKGLSSEELTRSVLARVEKHNKALNAYLKVIAEEALEQARASDKRRAQKAHLGPLDGIPLSLKDNLCTRGTETTCGSRMLAGFIPPYDAHVVTKLRNAGSVFVGKTNLDEFAMGSSTEHSAFGPTRNPWDPERVPGGSSGGSAVSVVADLALGSLGSDTGGSIRQPAALTGAVGLKPTYGRVSRYGLIAFASSLDQIGPLAKTVADAAILQAAIEGFDERDSTSVSGQGKGPASNLTRPLKGLKIGIAKEWLGEGLDPEVHKAIEAAWETLAKEGCRRIEISIPRQDYALPIYYLIAPAEASSNLARYDGVLFGPRNEGANIVEMYKSTRSAGFGAEVKRRIILGTYVLSAGYYDAYYLKALKARTVLRQDYLEALKKCDALLSPATPTPAFKIGDKTDDPLKMYLNDVYTVSVNLVGLPALVLPCGFSTGGLPIGMQLIGRAFEEDTLLRIGHQFEQASAWHMLKPKMES